MIKTYLINNSHKHASKWLVLSIDVLITICNFFLAYVVRFGIGLNFEAKPGIFSFSYALGKHVFYENGIQKDNGFSLGSGKVHFGFISYF